MATGLKSYLRLFGSLLLPPYAFPAGFIVTKIPALEFTFISLLSRFTVGCLFFIAN